MGQIILDLFPLLTQLNIGEEEERDYEAMAGLLGA